MPNSLRDWEKVEQLFLDGPVLWRWQTVVNEFGTLFLWKLGHTSRIVATYLTPLWQ